MLKTLASMCAVVIVASLASSMFSQPGIAAATNNITRTTSKVEQAALVSNAKASALGSAIQNNDANLPERLKEFNQATQRLISFRDTLDVDLGVYQNAAISALKRFDEEAQGIKDPGMLQKMQQLRAGKQRSSRTCSRQARPTRSDCSITCLPRGTTCSTPRTA